MLPLPDHFPLFIAFLFLLLFFSTRSALRLAVVPGWCCLGTWKLALLHVCNQSITSKIHAIHRAHVVANQNTNYGFLPGFHRHLAPWQVICENDCLSSRVIGSDNVPKVSDIRHHEGCETYSNTTSVLIRCVCKEYVWPCLVITSGFEEIVLLMCLMFVEREPYNFSGRNGPCSSSGKKVAFSHA